MVSVTSSIISGEIERSVYWCTECGAIGHSETITGHLTVTWRLPRGES